MSERNLDTICIIGAGKVAQTFGRMWTEANVFDVSQVFSRRLKQASLASEFIANGETVIEATSSWGDIQPASWCMVATPDDAIEDVVGKFIEFKLYEKIKTIFHCSGAKSSEVLAPLEAKGMSIASMHPIFSFASPENSIANFAGAYCALDGDEETLRKLESALAKIGANTFRISSKNKALYHLANVMVSNFLLTLLQSSAQLYQEFGVDTDDALKMLLPLMKGSLDNAQKIGAIQALTGPVVRGDVSTIEEHLDALNQNSKKLLTLYKELCLHTVYLAEQREDSPKGSLKKITAICKGF